MLATHGVIRWLVAIGVCVRMASAQAPAPAPAPKEGPDEGDAQEETGSSAVAAECNKAGNKLFELRNYAEAEASLRQAVRLDDRVAHYHTDLGNALTYLNRYPEAIEAYEAARRLQPRNGRLAAMVASFYVVLGDLDHAVRSAQEAVDLGCREHWGFARLAEAFNKRADAFVQQGDKESALAAAQSAVNWDPANGFYRNELGVVSFNLGRHAAALQAFGEATRLSPKNGTFAANHAGALLRLGRTEEARKAARTASELGVRDHWVFGEAAIREDRETVAGGVRSGPGRGDPGVGAEDHVFVGDPHEPSAGAAAREPQTLAVAAGTATGVSVAAGADPADRTEQLPPELRRSPFGDQPPPPRLGRTSRGALIPQSMQD